MTGSLRLSFVVSAGSLASLGAAAGADLSQDVITPPGGFVQAGAYNSTSGGGLIPGQDMGDRFGSPQEFNELAFAGNSSASASAQGSGTNISNSASGTAGMGFFRAGTFNSHPNSAFFSLAGAHGGWKETFTVSHADLNGQSGFMLFQLRASGTLDVTGFSGSCGVNTTGYKNNTELMMNAHFDRGGSDAISTDRQRAQWGLSTDGATRSRTVNDAITMAVPITFGQSFTLGVYAFARSSQRSSSGVGGISTGTLDFSGGGIEWGGISSVLHGGVPVSGYTIISGSGIDWVPGLGDGCPPDFNGDGFLNPDDLSDFITCFFLEAMFPGSCADGDFNGDGFINPDDLSDFITGFFLGCA